MSFLDDLGGLVKQFTGADPADLESAAADHVGGMNVGELAGHLMNGAQNMDGGTVENLVQSLTNALGDHGQDTGGSTDVGSLIQQATQNPGALKDAAVDFIKNNPQAIEQFTPDFAKGLVAKFTGG
jgi:hypothetical protein